MSNYRRLVSTEDKARRAVEVSWLAVMVGVVNLILLMVLLWRA